MALKSLFLGVLLLSLCISSSSSDPLRPDKRAHDYLRFAEVERHCRPLLSSATVLAFDTDRGSGLKNELSFEKGDWFQHAGGHAPLMPFDGSDVPSGGARRQMDPLSLATLKLTHVDLGRRGGARTALNASGILELSISRKSRYSDSQIVSPFTTTTTPASSSSPEFKISPGASKLRIKFEGVYTETAKGGEGERVLCMVGSALLPARSTGGADPWDWAKNSGRSGFLPPVRADDNILLVMRFPMEATLTTRAVLGEMRSTSSAGSAAAAYFDPVQLVSQLSSYPHHQPEELVADACSRPLPSIESSEIVVGSRGGGKLFTGSNVCRVLERYSYGHGVVTSPSTWQWQCSSTTSTAHDGASCRSCLGPFETDREVSDKDELADQVGIMLKDLQCYSDPAAGTERVSFVLRALLRWEDHQTAVQRSGLSGLTLSSEGVWVPSAGKACLVACRGTGDKQCHFRISMYIPMTFSITRRSILLGQITSVGAVARSPSLSFQLGLSSPQYWGYGGDGARLAFEYSYTKTKLAGELLRRSESRFGLRRVIASSLPVRYPSAHQLTLRFTTAPSMFRPGWMDRFSVAHLEIMFLEEVARASTITSDSEAISEKKRRINVAAELTFLVPFRAASPAMSLEGVYDPENGRMHLIGCRDVRRLRRWPPNNLSANGDLDLEEAGMDCSIEVRVDYPPTNTQWFIWSTAKVRIASTRSEASDPLHFHTMMLQAVPIHYPKPRPDDVDRGIINGVLGIVLLSASIAAALSQLRHLRTHPDVAPYVSLAMLCVQALGFVMPLFTGNGIDALVAKATIRRSDRTAASSYALAMNYPICRSIDRAVKVLSLAALAVTLCLVQKVHRSRARMLEPGRVPGEARVLAYQCAAHLALFFVLVLALNGNGHATMTAEQHVALLQDLFLLPQVIGNALWRVNCRPLAERYYLGVTAARLLLSHLYELVRPPPPFVYSSEYLIASARRGRAVFSDSSAWDVAVPAGAVLLGVVVYVQQRWNYAIVCRTGVRTEQRKLQQHIF